MSFFNANITASNNLVNRGHLREHCSARASQLANIGRAKGQQVRVEYFQNGSRVDFAAYTITNLHRGSADLIKIGFRKPETTYHDLKERLSLTKSNIVIGKVRSGIVHPSLSESAAKQKGELIEQLNDNGSQQKLVIIAPHGGDIEKHTAEQAMRLSQVLPASKASSWICKGFKNGGGAYDRWHITSTDIHEASFPKLNKIIDRDFNYAIAFHGWSLQSICIGGSAPFVILNAMKVAIKAAIAGSGIKVMTSEDPLSPEEFNGDSPRNLVNRLGLNGIHIEQSLRARKQYGLVIAEAVGEVIGSLL